MAIFLLQGALRLGWPLPSKSCALPLWAVMSHGSWDEALTFSEASKAVDIPQAVQQDGLYPLHSCSRYSHHIPRHSRIQQVCTTQLPHSCPASPWHKYW